MMGSLFQIRNNGKFLKMAKGKFSFSSSKKPGRVLVDGRVFSTEAYDRGMGRYVSYFIDILKSEGFDVTILLFNNCYLGRDDKIFNENKLLFANYNPEHLIVSDTERQEVGQNFTSFLGDLIRERRFAFYVDATPFLGPCRLDILACPVVSVCYDFIPLKHPSYYLSDANVRASYHNGLARVLKADAVICISETTKSEVQKYLGVEEERLSVIAPKLDPIYETGFSVESGPPLSSYVFGIAGAHKSKNPELALGLFQYLLRNGVGVKITAPKKNQLDSLLNLGDLDGIDAYHSVSEEMKLELQSQAVAITHLSLEEGFGIPLLEAVFLRKKLIVLDIAINREVLGYDYNLEAGSVFWLPSHLKEVGSEECLAFLSIEPNSEYYDRIQARYHAHWASSPQILLQSLNNAKSHYDQWVDAIEFKTFSSIPGNCCGVADYTMSYIRAAKGNVILSYSVGEQENVSHLKNVKIVSSLDFDKLPVLISNKPTIYHLAISDALFFGIKLLFKCGKPQDILIVHERYYLSGLWNKSAQEGALNDLLLTLQKGSEREADRNARELVMNWLNNCREHAEKNDSKISYELLKSLPVRFVSHLTPAVLERMNAALEGGKTTNDLSELEHRLDFVPLGIDDRSGAGVSRAAQKLRQRRGIQQEDIVVGHFGLIINDLKRLWDIAWITAHSIHSHKTKATTTRRMFFVLCGRIVDHELFQNIKDLFRDLGIAKHLVLSNPVNEEDFDAEIAACDGVFVFRKQTRGQLSHVFVRALSLGRPVIVDEDSGYAYDDRTLITKNNFAADVERIMALLFDPMGADSLRKSARNQYNSIHNSKDVLSNILEKGNRK